MLQFSMFFCLFVFFKYIIYQGFQVKLDRADDSEEAFSAKAKELLKYFAHTTVDKEGMSFPQC